MSFSGKVVLVTGGSSGIGAATAEMFAQEGAKVAIVGRNEAKLASVAQRCAAHGAPPLVIRADLSKEEEVKIIVKKTVDHFGKLDVLINNAGTFKNAAITDSNILEAYDVTMNTNLRSVVQLTNLAAPHLIAAKGNIVNVSSIVAHGNVPGGSPYCISKSALNHFTRCAAKELAPFGVRVNSVEPGPVKTDILGDSELGPFESVDAKWEHFKSLTALKRFNELEDIADLIAFLAGDKAKSITGSSYLSDNGYLLH